jgi:multiple sugar transport system ATP-binding protein
MPLGARVAVMRTGELQQGAPPQELYEHPDNLFVAGFIGSPAMNVLEARLERTNGAVAAVLGNQQLEIDETYVRDRPALRKFEGRDVIIGIRPEDLEDAEIAPDGAKSATLTGRVTLREALGSEIMAHFQTDARPAVTDEVRELAKDAGDEQRAERGADGGAMLIGRFGARSRVQTGETVTVAVDTRNVHFFDPDTGRGIYDE